MGLLHPQHWEWTETKNGEKVTVEHDGWGVDAYTTSQSNAPGDSMHITAYNGRYGTWYSGHTERFSADIRNINGTYIARWFLDNSGWTLNAVCGMLGNMNWESGCNPGAWQGYETHSNNSSAWGLGLTQWTRYFKYTDWVHAEGKDDLVYSIEMQCERIRYEQENNIQYGKRSKWRKYNFTEYSQSRDDPRYLGECFAACYERSAAILGQKGEAAQETAIKQRGDSAQAWWERLGGEDFDPAPEYSPDTEPEPEPEPEPEDTQPKIPIWLLFKLGGRIK